ncbi:MAG: hypothetical protein WCY34_00810 [Candidatus Omnitrophota bacterium]
MKLINFILLGFCLIGGCVPALIGVGVVTGYALSGDSATGNVNSEYRVLWDLSLDKLETMEAEIVLINESKGMIKAVISENSVVVKVNTINSSTQRLRVSARRCFMPRPQFAQKVFFKIVEELK